MARVRTSVALGTVAVLVLGGLSLGVGSLTMPSSTTLGGPVVLAARPDLLRPLIATPDGTTEPTATRTESASAEPVGVRAPTPIRADAVRTPASSTGSHHDTSGTSGTGDTAQSGTTGADPARGSTGSSAPTPDSPAAGTVATSGSAPVEPTHAPSAPSRSEELRGALATPIELTTSGTSTLEGTHTHDLP